MKRVVWLLAVLLLFAAQWAVPFMQVVEEETVRREGMAFRLALAPVDPYDVMRGRYLALHFPSNSNALQAPAGSKEGDTVYAVLEEGADGLAFISRLSAVPVEGAFALPLEFGIVFVGDESASAPLARIPLTRFYLPEEDAIDIDTALWQDGMAQAGNEGIQAVLEVRVLDGRIVAERLWLDGKPYEEWLRAYRAARQAQK